MYDINCGSPTVADDMLVCSFSVNGLIQIMVLCLRYKCGGSNMVS